jgi:hypothetical protein
VGTQIASAPPRFFRSLLADHFCRRDAEGFRLKKAINKHAKEKNALRT